ncbi:hypothetical protein NHQ30_002536 [Ciborinia camelliae]|nr:hypothetical protein NHQ30_002536 [Ciborinia camelliae]
MAQGANSSLEDGATIGALLSRVKRKSQISPAMEMYDTIRRPRVDQLVKETFEQGKEHHLPDGIEQVKRDELLSKSFETAANGLHATCAHVQLYIEPVKLSSTGLIPKFNLGSMVMTPTQR